MGITANLSGLSKEIPGWVRLVAVSKTMPPEVIMEAYHAGQRHFGENKAQEMMSKQPVLPDDIRWHFIGHLQTNKVKYIAPFVHMIESVDSLKLLCEIDRQAARHNRVIDCLLQFHIATEETKFGLDLAEADVLIRSQEYAALRNIKICGVMGMASFIDNTLKIRAEFSHLRQIFNTLKETYFANDDGFREISAGMSGDYDIAIDEGSTIVRIGSLIFGERKH